MRELKKHAIGSSVFVISRQTSSTDPWMTMRKTCVVSGTLEFLRFCAAFDSGLEVGHAACPRRRNEDARGRAGRSFCHEDWDRGYTQSDFIDMSLLGQVRFPLDDSVDLQAVLGPTYGVECGDHLQRTDPLTCASGHATLLPEANGVSWIASLELAAESWGSGEEVKSLKEAEMIYAGVEQLKERAHREGRATLVCRLASLKFGGETAERLSKLIEEIADSEGIARIGERIIECETGAELLARARED